MAVYLCHEFPDLYEHEATVVDAAPGRVVLDRSALHPGGGGQVSDVGWLDHAGGTVADHRHRDRRRRRVARARRRRSSSSGPVVVRVDAEHRSRVAQLHTDSHILNALVYDRFPGTLVTGAQINADGTGRMDFDLSEIDNDVLRGLDAGVNDVIRGGIEVRSVYVDAGDADVVAGLVRSLSVAPPPTPDGQLRVIEIDGVDRQACGGTHLSNTGAVAPVPHHQGREQGQAQPAHPLRARLIERAEATFRRRSYVPRSWMADSSTASRSCTRSGTGPGYAVLGRRADAEDCAQEAMARALARWDRVRGPRRRPGWRGWRRTSPSTGSAGSTGSAAISGRRVPSTIRSPSAATTS